MPRDKPAAQLALPVTLADHATFDNYFAADNGKVVTALKSLDPRLGHALWLWGPTGTGKSHLLQALCVGSDRAAYLPAQQLVALTPGVLEGFDRNATICVDDVDALFGELAWETALFDLYNAVADAGGIVLVASRDNPRQTKNLLADLTSRLRSGAVLELRPLSDAGKIAALVKRADLRGLELPNDTGRYLLNHYRRDMVSLCTLLDELDRASLAAQRRLTIPFVKGIVAS